MEENSEILNISSVWQGGLTIKFPDNKWKMTIGTNYFSIQCDSAPNWFHRAMQRLILGFKWEKLC